VDRCVNLRLYVLLPVLKGSNLEACTWEEVKMAASPGTEFFIDALDYGPSSIETYLDEELAAPFIVEKAMWADKQGFDAIIIDCMGDPAIHSCREVVRKPIVGPLISTISIASTLGEKFSIVTVLEESVPLFRRKVREYGFEDKLASVRYVNVPVLELDSRRKETEQALAEEVAKSAEDGADSAILGCTGMIGMARAVRERVSIPVIDSGVAQIKYAEMLVSLGLTHSQLPYPKPREKLRKIPSQYEEQLRLRAS